jgi:hypothetical protein
MRLKVDFNLVAMALAAVGLLEGLAIVANAHQVTVYGSSVFTGFARGTIAAAGMQLVALGAVAMAFLWLPRNIFPNVHVRKLMSVVPMLCGGAILIEGLLISYFASPIQVLGVDVRIQQVFVAAFGAQLFFLGTGVVLSWIFKERDSTGVVFSVIAFSAILSFGLWVASIAELVVWANFSGFFGRTVFTAGALLMAIGLVGLMLNYLEGKAVFGKSLFDVPLWSWGIIILGALVGLSGIIGISLADTVIFASHGGFFGTTVAMAMFGLFILGMAAFIPRFLPGENGATVGKTVHIAGLFLVLLLPFALLI